MIKNKNKSEVSIRPARIVSLIFVAFLILTSTLSSIVYVGAQEGTESWPTYKYNYQRTGATDNTGPKTNNLVWKWYSGITLGPTGAGFGITESSALVPAVVDGKVYVGTEEDRFVALDEFTGDLIWEFQTGGIVRTPPTVANGKVFFGSFDGYFYALNADTGALVWSYGPVKTEEFDVGVWTIGIVVQDGLVVFGAEDIYALNENDGSLAWEKDLAGGYDWALGNALDGNTLIVPSLDAKVRALRLNDGEILWEYETESYIESTPSIQNGKVYVGSTDNYTYCLDLSTGDLIWRTEHGWSDFWGFGGGGWGHPSVHNNKVFNNGPDGKLHAFDADNGNILWTFDAGNITWGGVAVVDGIVYGGSLTGKVYAVDEDSGTLIWDYEVGGEIYSTPAIVDGMLIWGSSEGYVYAIGEPVTPSEGIPTEYIYAIIAIVVIAVLIILYAIIRRR